MTRNWRTLTLAALLALASTAPAQKATWRSASPAPSDQATETTCPTSRSPNSETTIWDCQAVSTSRGCEDLKVTHGKEAAARMLMPDLMAEFLQTFNDGNLERAELIAEFACKLQPDCKIARRARWLVAVAKKSQMSSAGAEECSETQPPLHVKLRGLGLGVIAVDRRQEFKVLEVLPAPTPVEESEEESAVPPASLPCERAEPVGSADVPRPVIKVPGMVAQADHVFYLGMGRAGQPRRILLEGNVELYPTSRDQPAKILTGRALINPRDGSYEVMPSQVKPMLLKPTSVMPTTPMQEGWR